MDEEQAKRLVCEKHEALFRSGITRLAPNSAFGITGSIWYKQVAPMVLNTAA
jgi:hypothetical protein